MPRIFRKLSVGINFGILFIETEFAFFTVKY